MTAVIELDLGDSQPGRCWLCPDGRRYCAECAREADRHRSQSRG